MRRALCVDHAELAPQVAGADRDGFGGDPGQRVGRAEDVDDVDRPRHVGQALVALLAEDLGFARVDRNHACSRAASGSSRRSSWRAARSATARRSRRVFACVEHALDRQRILIAARGRRRRAGRARSYRRLRVAAAAAARAKPCSRSQIRSSTDSVPTDSRMVPGPTPAARSSSSFSCRCVVLAGMDDQALRVADVRQVRPQRHAADELLPRRAAAAQSNENTAPAPRGRYLSTSARYRLAGRPG